ncbi:hypothetical protein V6Z12_D06G187600 [Gossypium hirsutum]
MKGAPLVRPCEDKKREEKRNSPPTPLSKPTLGGPDPSPDSDCNGANDVSATRYGANVAVWRGAYEGAGVACTEVKASAHGGSSRAESSAAAPGISETLEFLFISVSV